jgi:shikimate dehydrogenase
VASIDPYGGTEVPERVFGIIGYPLRFTLSPIIHNTAFREAGLDWVYAVFRVPPGEAPKAVEAMKVLKLGGLSVTIPHKEAVFSSVDSLTPVAAATRAVNTLSWSEDASLVVGDNTDVAGFVRGLETSLGISAEGRNVVVLGSGGAARAVVWAVAQQGALSVTVAGRTPSRAVALVESITDALQGKPHSPRLRAIGTEGPRLKEACLESDLLINATPVGSDGTSIPVPREAIHGGLYVYDLVYSPMRTPLVEIAASSGAGAAGGLEMLIFQGALQFEQWSGGDAPIDAMRRAALAELATGLQNRSGTADKSGLK